jgi:3-oxoacyl-[acyl-carrier protein] reductase
LEALPFLNATRFVNFSNKNILITGGSRGIGRATVRAFAERGANVCFTYRANSEAAQSLVDQLRPPGRECRAIQAEASDESAMERVIDDMVQDWGSLDVAVANAGIWEEAAIDSMSTQSFERTMSANMTSSFILAKYAARVMKRAGHGSIVFISSTAGQRGEALHSHYAASKGAQISFTKSLAVELAPYGIRVNCIAPGWVETDMTSETLGDPNHKTAIRMAIPLGRPGKPEEIASAVTFIASDLATFITGEILNVNGGAVLCG